MVDRVRCPALGWSYNSYKIWMQAFSLVAFGLWLQHRSNCEETVRVALLDLYYLSNYKHRQERKIRALSKSALWQKCFFMYCKYKRVQKILQCISSCKNPSPSVWPIITL
ncbi:E4-2 [Deer mastadenovirus B]|uniref:E4-2 n=1 Tax=Deer mastadenovirus B TaxID=2170000 RepID=A0A1Y0B6I7_9ADEN|nr:E4-2 [Deer mastadenovirus B]ART33382.1 E4-2 [Deer mastadenovirus B]